MVASENEKCTEFYIQGFVCFKHTTKLLGVYRV